ncbi:MAG: pyridoxal-phosphate dependent enzyme, partial [Acetobacterales bacterium]
MTSHLLGLRPASDGDRLNDDMTDHPVCPVTGEVQEAVYDLAAVARAVDRDALRHLPRGMWRWAALLPVRDEANIVTMSEGDTPLEHVRRLGEVLGLSRFHIKDESRNPTGSFKDRGASVTASKMKEVSAKGMILASSGNAASSFSAYAARAGVPFTGFLRRETSSVHRLQTMIYGARVFVVEGTMVEGARLAHALESKFGLFHFSQPYNLYRVVG